MSKGNVGLFASNLTFPIFNDSRKTDKGRLAIKDTFDVHHIGREDFRQQFGTLSRPGLSVQGDCVFDHISGDGRRGHIRRVSVNSVTVSVHR